jgi:hypothetical protein
VRRLENCTRRRLLFCVACCDARPLLEGEACNWRYPLYHLPAWEVRGTRERGGPMEQKRARLRAALQPAAFPQHCSEPGEVCMHARVCVGWPKLLTGGTLKRGKSPRRPTAALPASLRVVRPRTSSVLPRRLAAPTAQRRRAGPRRDDGAARHHRGRGAAQGQHVWQRGGQEVRRAGRRGARGPGQSVSHRQPLLGVWRTSSPG